MENEDRKPVMIATKTFTVERVLSMLEGQPFYEWYTTTFEDYITGEEGCLTREQILKELSRKLT